MAMDTNSRAQTTPTAGARSGGKIVLRRRIAAAKTPYERPPPPPPPENSGSNWLTGNILPGTTRMIAKGAMKLFTYMTDTNSLSSSSDTEDENDLVSCNDDDDDDAPFEKDSTSTEMINRKESQLLPDKSPKWVIEKLLLQETFSREESDKLIEIIKSRVVDCSTMEERRDTGLIETHSRIFDTPDRCSKAVMEAKYWLEDKKAGSSSKSEMDHGLTAFGSVPLQHLTKFDKGSPVDMAKSYMRARPPWASPSLRHSGARTPSSMAIDLFKDEKLSSVDGSSFPSAQKRDTLSAGSWNIQDEIRKVRSKATEDMLRTLPSTSIDLSSLTSEHKNIQTSVAPDDGSYGDKMHAAMSLPETEPVDASVNLAVGSSTIHDSKGFSALGMKQDGLQGDHLSSNPGRSVSEPNRDPNVKKGTTTDSHNSISLEHLVKQHDANDTISKDDSVSTKYDVRNSGASNANGSASLRSSLSAGIDIEQHPRQPDNKPTTTISEEVCGFLSEASLEIPLVNEFNSIADGPQDSQDSAHQADIKNGTPGNKALKEKQQEKKPGRYQRKGRGRGK